MTQSQARWAMAAILAALAVFSALVMILVWP